MSKNSSRTRRLAKESIAGGEGTVERVRLIGELLQALAHAVAANEETQRRFQTAVLIRLSKIETIVQMIHGAQIVDAHISKPCFEQKMKEHATGAEAYVSEHSKDLGLKMVKYIYEVSHELGEQTKTRRKRRSGLSYEI